MRRKHLKNIAIVKIKMARFCNVNSKTKFNALIYFALHWSWKSYRKGQDFSHHPCSQASICQNQNPKDGRCGMCGTLFHALISWSQFLLLLIVWNLRHPQRPKNYCLLLWLHWTHRADSSSKASSKSALKARKKSY